LAKQKGLDIFRLQEVLASGAIADLFEARRRGIQIDRERFQRFLGLGPFLSDTFTLTINYGTLEEPTMVSEMANRGNFDWGVDEETFPSRPLSTIRHGEHSWEGRLFDPRRESISRGEAEWMARQQFPDWQQAQLDQLLAFSHQFPEEQRRSVIFAVGIKGDSRHYYLNGDDRQRGIGCCERYRRFGSGLSCRYLLVRKLIKPT
jgi:hypothetical protein